VRACRVEGKDPHFPTLRASIAIARVLATRGGEASYRNPVFLWACRDILSHTTPNGKSDQAVSPDFIDLILRRSECAEEGGKATMRSGRRAAARAKGGK
jgi:hypothetical protein